MPLLENQISGYIQEDLSLIESKARYKYGLIKEDEVFYKVNTIINTDNAAESSESTL
jgi:Septum formation initiator.